MARLLIVYGSEEGQTAKVAKRLAEFCRNRHHDVDLFYGKKAPADLSIASYDGVIVGASIHMGRHQKYMVELTKKYCSELTTQFSAFFTVCLTANSNSPEDKAQVEQYVQDFMEATNWYPDQLGVFAGALLFTRYGLIKRFLMKSISKRAGGNVDTSRDYEYTDWESVDDFGDSFLAAVAGESVLADNSSAD